MEREIEPAKVIEADVGFEDHGIFTLFAMFDYGGSCQGLGYCVDEEFIKQFIKACGVERLSQCVGRTLLVEHGGCKIFRLIPFEFDDGKEFNIEEWSEECAKKES